MIIDDDKILCKYLQRLLTANSFEVIIAHDGDSGYKSIIREVPDLLILDILLPDTDGLKLTQEIRKKSEFMNTPVILMSAIYKDAVFVRQIKEVADAFIEKPLKETDLLEVIDGLLGSQPPSKTLKDFKEKPRSGKEVQSNDKELDFTHSITITDQFTDVPELISQSRDKKEPPKKSKK